MIKNALIALVAVSSLGAAAAPALASPNQSLTYSVGTDSFDPDVTLARLHEMGVNATTVETWGTLVRAFVGTENGTQVMQYFTEDTLTPVTL